ncbi:MAG: 4Fe-4S ferredoxin [Oscillospiraceae bacterium]|nr:MAG: 4Fe-4S ferredoxin [Oscillospiraceae bacterium]
MMSKRVAEVDRSRCVACGACGKECPRQAIAVWRGCFARIDPLRCVGCGRCERVCPAGCIAVRERGKPA